MSRTIYIDKDFICHNAPDEGLRAVDAETYFDGVEDVSGFRFVPMSENWARNDGAVFTGLMIAPAVAK
ncbi:MAG TPA: hypothetical protein VN538_12705 [Clostridia bacterium]|nr:hypothetical protein [Clostridia bacterium]